MISPYEGLPEASWQAKTHEIAQGYPFPINQLYEISVGAWQAIFQSQIGAYRIGQDLFPRPQIVGYLLHELIALDLQRAYPDSWRREQTIDEKDLVYLPNMDYSLELKTSSHPQDIFGNRSYTQTASSTKKVKAGYYLVINFEGFHQADDSPQIRQVRFGWLDYLDWIGQKSSTGQQARLSVAAKRYKLLKLPLAE